MKNPAKRLIHAVIFSIAFIVIYTGIMYFIDQRHFESLIVMDNRSHTNSMRGILDLYEEAEEKIGEVFAEDLNAEVRLKTIALASGTGNSGTKNSDAKNSDAKNSDAENSGIDNSGAKNSDSDNSSANNGQYSGTRMWENAMAVRVTDGKLYLPAEAAGMFAGLTADAVQKEYALNRFTMKPENGDPSEVFLTSGRITDDWYYVMWTPVREFDDYVKSYINIQLRMKDIADFYGGEMFLVSAGENTADGEPGIILQGTAGVKGREKISDLGISEEDLQKEYFTLSMDDGNTYVCTPVKLKSGKIFVCCESVTEERAAFIGEIITQILFASALFAVLLTWCYSVIKLVTTTELKGDLIRKYFPKAVKKRTAKLSGMSVLLVFIVAFLTVAMQYMYKEDRAGNVALGILENQLETNTQSVYDQRKIDAARYETFGKEISGILTKDSSYLDKNKLKELAGVISADYIVVFDENGDEIGCSEDYTGLSLGTNEKEPSTDFRRLLNGISPIVHEPAKDFITGDTRQIVGIRYDLPEKPGQYGAILISLPLVADNESTGDSVKEMIYRSLDSTGEMILEIDPDSQLVVSGSNAEYVGDSAAGLGIKKESLADRHMDFFRIDGLWYFGVSRLIEGKIFYYLADNTTVLAIGTMFAVLTAFIFLIGYLLTARLIMHDYTNENYEKYTSLSREEKEEMREKQDDRADPASPLLERWEALLPEQKARRVLHVEMGLFMAALLIIAVSNTPLSRRSVLNFVIEGNWTKGVNVFGIVAVIMVFSIEYLLYLITKVVFSLLYGVLDAKGETVGRLLRSLINYLLVVVAVCMALSYLGVETVTLLTSLGLLSLAVSLGAKDIVADIISGIGIVFEGTYNVGDYVEIDGFKGKVLEIGIRSTKLLGDANDIKTINNSTISNVLNLSKRTSFCAVSFVVNVSEPLSEIEAMLARELPSYKDKIPGIISGPSFGGITGVEDGKMTLEIVAEAREEDINSVSMGLNRMMQSLYERGLLKPMKKDTSVILRFADNDSGVMRVRHTEDGQRVTEEVDHRDRTSGLK